MVPRAPICDPSQHARHEPLFDVHPRTGASIEVFYADRTLETFGKRGAGWFWWPRRRGFAPDGEATGPFATSYAAYRHAMNTAALVRQPQPARQRQGEAALLVKELFYEQLLNSGARNGNKVDASADEAIDRKTSSYSVPAGEQSAPQPRAPD